MSKAMASFLAYRDHSHMNSLHVRPPEQRKALVVLYLFAEPSRDTSRIIMEHLAAQALEQSRDVTTVVVFGRSTEHWEEPYEAVLVATRNEDEG